MTLIRIAAIAPLLLAAMAWAEDDLAFIAKTPGVGRAMTREGDRAVYALAGNFREVEKALRAGLEKNGWKVAASANIGGLVVFRATRGADKLKLAIGDSMGTVSVEKESGGAAAASAGTSWVFDQNGVSKTIDCSGADEIALNSNGVTLTLNGACGVISVNGNRNVLHLKGTVKQLLLMGNDNVVGWTGKTPSITNVGNRNEVKKE